MPASARAVAPASLAQSGESPSLVQGFSNLVIPTPITNVRLLKVCSCGYLPPLGRGGFGWLARKSTGRDPDYFLAPPLPPCLWCLRFFFKSLTRRALVVALLPLGE